ncbi:hypothetical protein [Marilutibacter maris]|uniref:Uncharacterized protein n=1 Tax=Marilutibacter maris TaxID=1605891 RepID=A0A2U9TAJ4_9GAMM|nr:hypothetical protein [Lysobacter maris]AWV08622.1 hypothetical protein C9I47_2953 [Lysobacter maris]
MVATSPLHRVIALLQGTGASAIADVGIADLLASELDAPVRSAEEQAELCRERAELMRQLLETRLAGGVGYPVANMLIASRHLVGLRHDLRRWRDLAGSARYYREHPAIALRIARAGKTVIGDGECPA